MRFLHTSDWHLGRLFHRVHLTEDQAFVLDQFVDLARRERPDAVLISGDIYDRAVPPPEAVRLLDDTLSRLTLDLGIPTVVIAGNHDGPDRLAFGSRLLAGGGLHLFGLPGPAPEPIRLEDAHGPVFIHAVPYAEPPVVREAFGVETVHDHHAAMVACLDAVRSVHPEGARSVVLAHAFVAGGAGSESERPLSVGGAGTVEASAFAGFDYVALGHLHRPQSLARDRLVYAGSLLKYSFDEATHRKSVSLVEMDAAGACTVERIALTPRREVRRISGLHAELLAAAAEDPAREYNSVMLRSASTDG